MSEPLLDEFATILFIKALSERLGEDQGVIIHHDERAFIVYKNTTNKTMGIQEDEQFFKYPNGTLVTTGISKQMANMEIEQTEAEEDDPRELFTKVKDGPSFKLGPPKDKDE